MDEFISALDQYEILLVGQLRNPNDEDVEDNRAKQISDYLDSSKDPIDRIVILDDNDDGISNIFQEEFIKVSRFLGLTEETAEQIKTILDD